MKNIETKIEYAKKFYKEKKELLINNQTSYIKIYFNLCFKYNMNIYEECESCFGKVDILKMIVKETPGGNCIIVLNVQNIINTWKMGLKGYVKFMQQTQRNVSIYIYIYIYIYIEYYSYGEYSLHMNIPESLTYAFS